MSCVTPLGKDSWKLVPGFFQILCHVPLPFADFTLYLLAMITLSCESSWQIPEPGSGPGDPIHIHFADRNKGFTNVKDDRTAKDGSQNFGLSSLKDAIAISEMANKHSKKGEEQVWRERGLTLDMLRSLSYFQVERFPILHIAVFSNICLIMSYPCLKSFNRLG